MFLIREKIMEVGVFIGHEMGLKVESILRSRSGPGSRTAFMDRDLGLEVGQYSRIKT